MKILRPITKCFRKASYCLSKVFASGAQAESSYMRARKAAILLGTAPEELDQIIDLFTEKREALGRAMKDMGTTAHEAASRAVVRQYVDHLRQSGDLSWENYYVIAGAAVEQVVQENRAGRDTLEKIESSIPSAGVNQPADSEIPDEISAAADALHNVIAEQEIWYQQIIAERPSVGFVLEAYGSVQTELMRLCRSEAISASDFAPLVDKRQKPIHAP